MPEVSKLGSSNTFIFRRTTKKQNLQAQIFNGFENRIYLSIAPSPMKGHVNERLPSNQRSHHGKRTIEHVAKFQTWLLFGTGNGQKLKL